MKNRTVKNFLIKTSAIFLVMLFIVFIKNSNAQYTTEGQNFINIKTGKKVILRGFGIGCWLLPEGYMWGIRKIDRPRQFEHAIEELIGQKDAKKFWKLYHENFLTESDVAAMKSWGVNTLRIPILASVLQPRADQPNRPPYNYSKEGFGLLDSLVKWCEKYKVGIIWDMHGAPGGQNAENISDSDGKARLWTEKDKYWPRTIELWYKIADRYKNKDCITGYDLLNEPLLIRYKNIDPKLLRQLYVMLTDTIRTVDKKGIIFIEGDDWAQTFNILEPMNWDPHLAMAFHSYPPTSDSKGLARWDKFRKKYNIPLWHGETGEQGPPYTLNKKATKFLESVNVSWSWWTHKKFDLETQPWSIVRTPGFLKILDYWKGEGPKPSKEQAKEWLFEQARLTNSKYCQFYPKMVRSLIPLNPDKYLNSKKIIKPEIVIQPENMKTEEGGVAEAFVKVSGFPLNYQWYKNGKELPDQNDYRLYISNPSLNDNNNSYFVRITNAEGTTESNEINLNVTPFSGIVIHKSSSAPVIDAVPDNVWEKTQPIYLKKFEYRERNLIPDPATWIKLLWDDANLYLWAQIPNDVADNNNGKNNIQDALEIYFDPDNSKSQSYGKYDYQLLYKRDSGEVEGIRGELGDKIIAAQKNVDKGYQMELAIPWAAVHGNPRVGQFIGIDVNVIYNENGHRSVKQIGNSMRGFFRRSPMNLGTMKLE